MEHMLAATAIKMEPECWIMDTDGYEMSGDLYGNEAGSIAYTEYEIRPFDYRFEYDTTNLDFVGDGGGGGGVAGVGGFMSKGILHTAEQLQIKGLCEVNSDPDVNSIIGDSSDSNMVTVVAPFVQNNSSLKRTHSPAKRQRINYTTESDMQLDSPSQQQEQSYQQQQNQQHHINQQQQQQQHDENETIDDSPHWFTATDSTAGDEATGVVGDEEIDEDDDDNEQEHEEQVFITTPISEHNNVVVLEQQVVTSGTADNAKSLGNIQLGLNGGLMGVSLGYLDFAPEPTAPAATPVTEHVEIGTPTQDTRDLSNAPNGEVRIKFETLRPLDQDAATAANSNASTIIKTPLQQQKSVPETTKTVKKPADTIVLKGNAKQQNQTKAKATRATKAEKLQQQQQLLQEQQQKQQQEQQQQQQQMDQEMVNEDQDIIMEIDPTDIKREQNMILTPDLDMMGTSSDNMAEIYQSDASEDAAHIKQDKAEGDESISFTEGAICSTPDNKQSIPKTWTQESMHSALEALRTQNMSLTKASVLYGIPSTTLWQRAHRLGIDTPKKEGPTKSWSEQSLNNALDALRTGQISANKASKAYGIPSSTLYKIARREGIRLAAPFNAAPTTWSTEDLDQALDAIRSGSTSVQKASLEFGIPTGTLYGRCKREGIELSRSNPTPWSEDAMMNALESVRLGQMSINQAAIHFNLPYSSLYGRFKRGKYDISIDGITGVDQSPDNSFQYSPANSFQSPVTGDVVHIQQQQQQQESLPGQIDHHDEQQHLHNTDIQSIIVSSHSNDDQQPTTHHIIDTSDDSHQIQIVEEIHHHQQIIYQTVKTEES